VTFPVVAKALILATTAAGVDKPSSAIKYEAKPATWGVAMLVPLIVLVAEVPPIQELRMLTPGAKISRIEPKFEKDALASVLLVAPTVMAFGAEAGE
jgi:hypothetical protein